MFLMCVFSSLFELYLTFTVNNTKGFVLHYCKLHCVFLTGYYKQQERS